MPAWALKAIQYFDFAGDIVSQNRICKVCIEAEYKVDKPM